MYPNELSDHAYNQLQDVGSEVGYDVDIVLEVALENGYDVERLGMDDLEDIVKLFEV